MRSLILVVALFALEAEAKKFALVVGGAGNANMSAATVAPKPEDIRPHEFGKSTARSAYGLARQGYEVITLFDNATTPQDNMPAGLKALQNANDVATLKQMGAQSATKESILNALRRIRDEAKPGDEFEFNLNAHGFRSCPGDEVGRNGVSTKVEDRQNSKAGCQHMINLSDANGRITQVPTAEFAEVIREIDEKGIKTNLNLSSCHSGAAQDIFAGLKNTCVAYGSSANNYSFMCMPGDKKGDVSYTSTLDNVIASQWIAYAKEMKKLPYFKDDTCLDKLAKHARKNGIEGKTRYDLFMKARLYDLNGEGPSLSSHQNLEYFKSGLFSTIGDFYARGKMVEICAESVDARISEFQELADAATKLVVQEQIAPKRVRLKKAIDRYNDLLKQQRDAGADDSTQNVLTKAVPSEDESMTVQEMGEMTEEEKALFAGLDRIVKPEELESQPVETQASAPTDPELLKRLQEETYEVSKEVMALEREIVNDLDQAIARPQIPESDPCRRS